MRTPILPPQVATKTITYVTANTGATGSTTLFTVTGTVQVQVFAVCSVDLTGAAATLEVGITANTAAVIAQTLGTTIDTGEIWYGAAPPTVGVLPASLILSGTNILQLIGTHTVDAGVLQYFCIWTPLSQGATVVAA